jgi:hypothetical protein
MKHFILFLGSAALVCAPALGQSSIAPAAPACTLTQSQQPQIHGLKLGMRVSDLNSLFPGLLEQPNYKAMLSDPDRYPYFGLVNIQLSPGVYPNKADFAGVVFLSFGVFDGRVERFRVDYQQPPVGPHWHSVDEFIGKLAEAFKLPSAADWSADQNENASFQKSLKCNGFEVHANISGAGSFTFSNPDLNKKQQERQEAFEEKKRREFKP